MILVVVVDFVDSQNDNKRYNVGDRFECLCEDTANRFISAKVVEEVNDEATKSTEETKEGVKEVKPKGRPKQK